MIADDITAFLKGTFSGYEIPKKFMLLQEDFSLENGTLNQTMKLKRISVLGQNQDRLDALYTPTLKKLHPMLQASEADGTMLSWQRIEATPCCVQGTTQSAPSEN